jgi:hypothetical protein
MPPVLRIIGKSEFGWPDIVIARRKYGDGVYCTQKTRGA